MSDSKPWRVHQDYASQGRAYDAVDSLTGLGVEVRVEHWEHGRWVLYERIQPEGSADTVLRRHPEADREAGS